MERRQLLSFEPAVSYTAGAFPHDVVVADFTNDGRLDVASLNSDDATVSVLKGNGDGTFQAAQTSAGVMAPMSVAVGDFNEDGKLDLITGNYDSGYYNGNYYGTGENDASILFGNGVHVDGPPGGTATPQPRLQAFYRRRIGYQYPVIV